MSGCNIRRNEWNPKVWEVAEKPATVRADSWYPLQRLHITQPERDIIVMRSGQMLGVAYELQGDVSEVAALDGDLQPLHFSVLMPGVIRMLAKHQATRYITYSEQQGSLSFKLAGAMPPMPWLQLVVANETSLSQPVAVTKLSGLSTSHHLALADSRTLTANLLSAYQQLKNTATEAGYFLQPTIARYRLLDAAGDTIMVGPPLFVAAKSGFQCCGSMTLKSDDKLATLNGTALQARAYTLKLLGLMGFDEPWSRIVANVVVETLPQFEPLTANQLCQTAVSDNGSEFVVTARLPGVSATSVANIARQRTAVVKALRNAATAGGWVEQLRVSEPFSTSVAAAAANGITVSLQNEEVIGNRIGTSTSLNNNVIAPVRDDVSYGACCQFGDTLVLANQLRQPFSGYPLHSFGTAVEGDTGDWEGLAVVELNADNNVQVAVATDWDASNCVSQLSPLLVVPDATARKLSLTLRNAAGEILTESFPLTPLPEANLAYYLDSSLAPVMPRAVTTKFNISEPTVEALSLPGMVVVADAGAIGTPKSSENLTDGAIVAIAEAPRSRSTWDFARRKLLLFGSRGTQLLTIDGDSQVRSVATLDNRAVADAAAVCCRTGAAGMELLAIAAGDLVRVAQSSVTTLLSNCQAVAVGWCNLHKEIWLKSTDTSTAAGKLVRLSFYKGKVERVAVDYAAATTSKTRLLPWGSDLLLAADGELLTTEASNATGAVKVGLRTRHRLSAQLRALRFSVFAAEISGSIAVAGDNGSQVAEPLATFSVEGALNAPFTVAIPSPWRRFIEVTTSATVSADANIGQLQIAFCDF